MTQTEKIKEAIKLTEIALLYALDVSNSSLFNKADRHTDKSHCCMHCFKKYYGNPSRHFCDHKIDLVASLEIEEQFEIVISRLDIYLELLEEIEDDVTVDPKERNAITSEINHTIKEVYSIFFER